MDVVSDLATSALAWRSEAVYVSLAVILAGIIHSLAGLWLRKDADDLIHQANRTRPRLETASFVRPEEYPKLKIPEHHHIEIAMDPPNGLCYSNPEVPYSFENEFVTATFIYFTLPTTSEPSNAGGLDYQKYFKGKKRLWELRFQFHFKQKLSVGSNMFFGFKLEEYSPMPAAIKRTMNVAVAAIRRIAGGIYYSIGDDPAKVTGELERQLVVLPMWAFDQFIETPEGETPPKITDADFPQVGHLRKDRVREYIREVSEFHRTCRPGPTYTFAHWGTSRFLDFLTWSLVGLPVVTPLSFNKLTGGSLVQVVCYSLRAPEEGSSETRHLDSRKDYYFKARLWHPAHRPKRSQFEAITGATQASGEDETDSASTLLVSPISRLHSMRKAGYDALSCCTGRDQ